MREIVILLLLLAWPCAAESCGVFQSAAQVTPALDAVGDPVINPAPGKPFHLLLQLETDCKTHNRIHAVTFLVYKDNRLVQFAYANDAKHPLRFDSSISLKDPGEYWMVAIPASPKHPPVMPNDPLGSFVVNVPKPKGP